MGDTMIVTEWDTAVGEHGAQSAYVELFWLPVIGPTAYLLLRHLTRRIAGSTDGATVDVHDMAEAVGCGFSRGTSKAFGTALQRLVMFGLAHQTEHGYAVKTFLPLVPARHLRRKSDAMQKRHDAAVSAVGPKPCGTVAAAKRHAANGEQVLRRVRAGAAPVQPRDETQEP